MARCIISPAAERDIESILAWSHEQFGMQGRLRHEAFLIRAILDVAEDSQRASSHARTEIAPAARTYHLVHSRDRVKLSVNRVHRPRHFLLYRVREEDRVEIGRVLHDTVDILRHVPEDHASHVIEKDDPESS